MSRLSTCDLITKDAFRDEGKQGQVRKGKRLMDWISADQDCSESADVQESLFTCVFSSSRLISGLLYLQIDTKLKTILKDIFRIYSITEKS